MECSLSLTFLGGSCYLHLSSKMTTSDVVASQPIKTNPNPGEKKAEIEKEGFSKTDLKGNAPSLMETVLGSAA